MNMHIVYSVLFVDRGASLSFSTYVKDTSFEYSSRRAEFCEFGPEMLTRDVKYTVLFMASVDIPSFCCFSLDL